MFETDEEAFMKSSYYTNREYDLMIKMEEQRYRRAARARQVRRQKRSLIIGVLITMAFISFFSVKAFANTNTDTSVGFAKQYKSVMVYCGDTVESIAEDNYSVMYSSVGKMADEIRTINHISRGEKLVPGNYIVVPYFEMASGY